MAKQPFTTDGVQQKIAELYRMSDTDLATQSNLIATNFRQWMSDNFSLNGDQQTYLTKLDNKFVTTFGRSLSNAVNNRLPINFTMTAVPSGASKFVRHRDNLTAVYNTNGVTVSGELDIDIGPQ